MSSPLPLRPAVDHSPRARSALDLTEDRAAAVFDALGSETARSILDVLGDEPATASEIADRVETSLQNVQYHLSSLEAADLVADVGTWYSARGTEMSVYAPAIDRVAFRVAEPTVTESDGSAAGGAPTPTASVLND